MLEDQVCFDRTKSGSKYKYNSGKEQRKINNVGDAYDILLNIINNKGYIYWYEEYTKDKTEKYANIDVFELRKPMKVTLV